MAAFKSFLSANDPKGRITRINADKNKKSKKSVKIRENPWLFLYSLKLTPMMVRSGTRRGGLPITSNCHFLFSHGLHGLTRIRIKNQKNPWKSVKIRGYSYILYSLKLTPTMVRSGTRRGGLPITSNCHFLFSHG